MVNAPSEVISIHCEMEQEKKSYLEKWIQLATDSMFGLWASKHNCEIFMSDIDH